VKVALAGAGIIGALCALQLRAAGVDVVLYDDAEHTPPASWAGGGILSPLFPWRHTDALNRLCGHALDDYRKLAGEIVAAGGVDPEVDQTGMLVIDEPQPEQALAWSQRLGRHIEMRQHQGRPCLWMPDVGSVRNSRLLKGLRTLLAARGIEAFPRRLSAFVEAGAHIELQFSDGSVAHADKLVISAGWQSSVLLAGHPLASMFFPAKGQMLLLRMRPGAIPGILLTEGAYLIPRRDGLVLLGSTLEPGRDDLSVTTDARNFLLEKAARLLPGIMDVPVVAHWAGVRPGCHRDTPVIGPVAPGSKVWLCTGHYRNGLVAAPASASLLATMITGGTPGLDSRPYSVSSSLSSPASSESF